MIERLALPASEADVQDLARLLVDAVESGAAVSFLAPLTQARARQLAADFLARVGQGDTPDDGVALYGYFTFDVERGGAPVGMLSVHASSGQIWYHTWHGAFIQEREGTP